MSDETPSSGSDDESVDEEFDRELSKARSLLADADDVDAVSVGVVREGEVDTAFAQRAADAEEEGLQALALLAAHVRLVADEAGVDPSTVAADAASLAGQVSRIPADSEALPDE